MADYRGAWLIGSIEDMDTQTVTIGGMPLDLSGDLYLYDTTLARSLISRFAGLMSTAGIAAPLAFIRRSGYVYLESSGVFTVNWGASTILRDLLGFDANLSGASSYVAPYKSPLLFAPGKPETPVGHRLGTAGHKVHTQYQAVSAFTGRAVSVSHGSRTFAHAFAAGLELLQASQAASRAGQVLSRAALAVLAGAGVADVGAGTGAGAGNTSSGGRVGRRSQESALISP